MERIMHAVATENSVRAILEGGPIGIPEEARTQLVSPLKEKVKVPHCGGHEHFERVSEPDEQALSQEIVFRWTMRTKPAE